MGNMAERTVWPFVPDCVLPPLLLRDVDCEENRTIVIQLQEARDRVTVTRQSHGHERHMKPVHTTVGATVTVTLATHRAKRYDGAWAKQGCQLHHVSTGDTSAGGNGGHRGGVQRPVQLYEGQGPQKLREPLQGQEE